MLLGLTLRAFLVLACFALLLPHCQVCASQAHFIPSQSSSSLKLPRQAGGRLEKRILSSTLYHTDCGEGQTPMRRKGENHQSSLRKNVLKDSGSTQPSATTGSQSANNDRMKGNNPSESESTKGTQLAGNTPNSIQPLDAGSINVADICFGIPREQILKGIADLNRKRQEYTKEDGIHRPLIGWNNDLSYMAYQTAATCKFEHLNFPGVGQNIGGSDSEASIVKFNDLIWQEKAIFIKDGPQGEGGHIGAALFNQVTAMGCANVDCTGKGGPWTIVCNFNQDVNANLYPPYEAPITCAKPGKVSGYKA